ncbi:MAG: lactate utilization protein [Clostridia bacterium]|nr:lactate utilization protein [Clostridia bacterium]
MFEALMENLKKNNMEPFFAETKEEVVSLVESLTNEGDTVSCGGSVTLKETGVSELLKCGRYNFLDRSREGITPDEVQEIYRKTFSADVFFGSCNALTEKGEIYNVDGNANRVSAITFGPKNVILIVGKNKIVKDLKEAEIRVKTICAPRNCQRLGLETYCAKTGRCVSLNNENHFMSDGCESESRICCSYTVLGHQRTKGRIKVIIVNEDLGF